MRRSVRRSGIGSRRITGSTRVPGPRVPLAAASSARGCVPPTMRTSETPPASARLAASSFRIIPPETLFLANQVFDFGSAHRPQNFFAIEHARHIRQKNQAVGVNEFRRRRGHVIGVDVVKLAVGAQSHAGSDGHKSRTPERAQEIDIHFGEIADKSEAAFAIVDLHRFGEKARGVGRADADGRLSGQRNRARQFLIEQAGKHHDGRVARLAIGDAQAVHEAARDAHARQGRRENFPAAVNDEQFVARARKFSDLPRDAPARPRRVPAARLQF